MPDFGKFLTDLLALKTAITTAGTKGPAILRAFLVVGGDAADAWDYFTTPALMTSAAADPNHAKCVAACDDIVAAIKAEKSKAFAAAPGAPVGALWDGSIFKMLLGIVEPFIVDILKKLLGG